MSTTAQRPHDALGGVVRLDRYQASPRQFPLIE
ncbi:hypothetical protein GGE07_006468 [Sinorhizobium terangae]|nr:hypothetical protein [Sinorhizobium terangae]